MKDGKVYKLNDAGQPLLALVPWPKMVLWKRRRGLIQSELDNSPMRFRADLIFAGNLRLPDLALR
jgi:hypothetical protein